MSYKLKFLVGNFLIIFLFIITASAQNFADKESVFNVENKNESNIRKKKPEFGDLKRRYFTNEQEKNFNKPSFPILEELPEKFGKTVSDEEKAEEETRNYRFKRGEKEINFEFAISPFRPTHFLGPEEYDTDDRKLGLPTFRWGRVIGTKKTITYQYLFESSFVYSYRNEVKNPEYVSPTATPFVPPTIRATSYGLAVTPVAFRLYFFSKSRFKPFGQFGAGFLFTNDPMPLPETSRFNFTGYFGGGAMYHVTRKQGISLGYRYYHISNFQTAELNPGYNANTFSIGYSFFYGK